MVLRQKNQQNVSTFFNELLDDFVILCAILFWVDIKSHCLLQIGSANKTVSIGIEQIELQGTGSHQSARRKSNRRGKQELGMKMNHFPDSPPSSIYPGVRELFHLNSRLQIRRTQYIQYQRGQPFQKYQ